MSRDALFVVVETDASTGHVHLRWTAKANRVYRVIKSFDLQTWADAPSGPTPEQQSLQTAAADGVLEYFDPVAATSDKAFYRVRLVE